MRYLLILACSRRKRAGGIMPAWQRYDGPVWQSLRQRLADLPRAALAFSGDGANQLDVLVLSARFGLIGAWTPIPDYDQRLDATRLAHLQRRPLPSGAALLLAHADDIGVIAGSCYRQLLGQLHPRLAGACRGAGGEGIGKQRARLGRWLRERFA